MNRQDNDGGAATVARIRSIQARGGRLTGDMVARIIDDEDDTFKVCRCGAMGFNHRPLCQHCDCDGFVERDYPQEG